MKILAVQVFAARYSVAFFSGIVSFLFVEQREPVASGVVGKFNFSLGIENSHALGIANQRKGEPSQRAEAREENLFIDRFSLLAPALFTARRGVAYRYLGL